MATKSTLNSSQGLTGKDLSSLREKYGWNEIPEKKRNIFLVILSYFWGPIPWMIEAAAILSAILMHWDELIIIGILLFINAAVGFWEEHKAESAIALLKEKLSLVARTFRDGKWQDLPSRELLPGDLVLLRLGNIVPADIKLTSGDYLSVDQSALTGESLPVEKKKDDDIYSGSIIKQGEMKGIVTGIGLNTYFGRTAKLVEEAGAVSHFQRSVLKIGNFLILITIALICLIIVIALYRHEPFLETLQFALILTVAAIPVALPAVLSVTMAVGAIKLAKLKAIVSRLVSIEELASMDLLCSDKTGTLTQNRLTVSDPWLMKGVTKEALLLEAALASSAESGDTIDNAVLAEVDLKELKDYKSLHFEPFNPVVKRTKADIQKGNEKFSVIKGAPQVVLGMCKSKSIEKEVQNKIDEYAEKGYRTLGVAKSKDGKEWTFRGLVPFSDPPRKDAAGMLDRAKEMGIGIKMMTGDHVAIAKEIAAKLHLGTNILLADDLFGGGKKSNAIEMLEKADGIAQVFPEHKFDIVKDLQQKDHVVGMTGDGVNDAPALKQADVGIAVSGATDAARAAASIVLTAPGIATIITAIEEARRIFHRMTSYATFRIAETIRVLLFMTLSIVLFSFYPVTAVMIVFLALLNDFPIMTISIDNALVAEKPVRWNMAEVLTVASAVGITGVISSFILFWYIKVVMLMPEPLIKTTIFLKLLVAGHLTLFITRSRGWFWQKPWPSWVLLVMLEGTQIIGTLAAVYGIFMTPIGWLYALGVWSYALVWFFIGNVVRVLVIKILDYRTEQHQKHLSQTEGKVISYGSGEEKK